MKRIITIVSLATLFLLANHALSQTTWTYISPMPGSKYINPENNIAFRHGDVLDISSIRSADIRVIGSIRGTIPGSLTLSKDQRTLIFYPDKPFALKEKISVKLNRGIRTVSGLEMEGVEFSFKVKEKDNLQMLIDFYASEDQADLPNNVNNEIGYTSGNRESEDYPEGFPIPTVAEFDDPAPGYIFLGPRPLGAGVNLYDPYLLVLDNYGIPVFYRQWPRRTNDFKITANDQLTFCDFDRQNPTINKYLILNKKFEITDTLLMGNGYVIDQHDMLLFENGSHFLMAYDPQLVNMDTVVPGGDTAATVIGFVIQELDADHNVIFQWRSWDHFEITDANHTDFLASQVDYVHGNAFEVDTDGNLLMSCRNMEEITKIDRNTGDIIWRFGLHAQNNMFTFTNDTVGFSWQHDIRRINNGNVTVYDNGNYHTPKFSQALEYQLDEINFTAERVWNYIHDPVVYGRATGAHRRLANGNAFICWGLTWPINVSEVRMDGNMAWELHWPENVWEYRAFKFDWVTDYFSTNLEHIDYGIYDDYIPWPRIFTVTNNSDQSIEITSTHNHWDSYYVSTPLPLEIPAGGSEDMTVNFFPTMQGQINDVLTLNFESNYSDTLPQRISRQITLTGFVQDDTQPEVTLNPADGTVNFPQDTTINISFDEPVVKIGGETLKVEDLADILVFQTDDDSAMAVEYYAVINAWKTKITIVPDTLYPDQNYYLEVKANMLSDNEENAISEPAISHFTTGEEFGITENILEFVNIFPNPTNDILNIEIKDKVAEFIRVMDISGRVLYKVETPSDQQISIDLTGQPSGIYIVELKLLEIEEAFTLKVVKK